jgi:adenylate cyclase
MPKEGLKRKLAAILSADVEGYSRLMGNDEASTIHTLTAYKETMSVHIKQHRGRVVDAPGDNLLAEFASVVDAVQCAVEIQRDLAERNEELPDERKMVFRIGVNLGDVVEAKNRIYGDGVNIAARLESICEGGGVCISGTAFEHIENKLNLGFDDLGDHDVKNITKPVRVYRVKLEVPKSSLKARMSDSLPLPDKPSIAVLPFTNMSGDQEQEYFSDGITEDIITELSRFRNLFVIARHSSFGYRDQRPNIKQIGRELGVRLPARRQRPEGRKPHPYYRAACGC